MHNEILSNKCLLRKVFLATLKITDITNILVCKRYHILLKSLTLVARNEISSKVSFFNNKLLSFSPDIE